MAQVTVTIDAEGNVKVAASGIQGTGCKALTAAIEASLGETTKDIKSAEFYAQATQPAAQKAWAGGQS